MFLYRFSSGFPIPLGVSSGGYLLFTYRFVSFFSRWGSCKDKVGVIFLLNLPYRYLLLEFQIQNVGIRCFILEGDIFFLYYLITFSYFLISNSVAIAVLFGHNVMAGEALSNLCSQLSLQEGDKQKVVIDNSWVEGDGENEARHCLIGKLMLKKPAHVDGLRNVLHQAWRLEGDLIVQEVGERLFVFEFQDALEKDRVLVSQPWSFKKALLVLKDYDGIQHPESIQFNKCPFWVRLFYLPLRLQNERVGIAVGEAIGEVLDIDPNWGRFMRLRVLVDLLIPLKAGTTVATASGDLEVEFRHERMADFCYFCGLLDHQEGECPEGVIQNKEIGFFIRRYSDRLKAETPVIRNSKQSPGVAKAKSVFAGLNREGKLPMMAASLSTGGGAAKQRTLGSSMMESEWRGGFKDHVDSLLLRGRATARAIAKEGRSREMVSKVQSNGVEKIPGDQEVSSSKFRDLNRKFLSIAENKGVDRGIDIAEGVYALQQQLLPGGMAETPNFVGDRGSASKGKGSATYAGSRNAPAIGPCHMGLGESSRAPIGRTNMVSPINLLFGNVANFEQHAQDPGLQQLK
ncbi:hypothetical protein CCACVL1_23510 [Corchorus capsularis]|uniref:Zinc knuckle CX2CX4HX4C n=1 Tax=Corchorus capsularis TaxID=210143 RepID=A0A1R3GTL3_COCAP|nr:hypothetical protein CCACVL1_23510 [Corchorus capsularis]